MTRVRRTSDPARDGQGGSAISAIPNGFSGGGMRLSAGGNDGDGCTNACTDPLCGDGIVNDDDECDDGNDVDDDACTNACTLPVRGDGIVNNAEPYDDGNDDDTDDCDSDCSPMVPAANADAGIPAEPAPMSFGVVR